MPELRKMTCQEERLGKMNQAQRQAVTHGEGPLLLLAGPGSGKTFTITNRILYLLEQGNPAETILVITFTKEAALSMRNRFHKMVSSEGGLFYPVNFGTFHSIFYHILQESNVLKSSRLLRLSEKKSLLYPILQHYGKQQEGSGQNSYDIFGEDAQQILAAVSFYKNTMCFSSAADKAPARWRQYFEEIYYQYADAVKSTGRVDFDDMLYECRNLLLENKAMRKYWQSRFQHILMDEFQDINPVQYEVVKLLAAKPYNLFAVGDDDQAIYGFRGSEPECLKRFKEEFRAKQLLLDINYRSRAQIVQASLAVIGENKDRFEKKLRAAEQSETTGGMEQEQSPSEDAIPVTIRVFGVKEEEYEYMMRTLSENADACESRAVLFRTNSFMQGFAARLKAADISYEMKEKAVSIYEHFIVSDIMAYLQVAAGEGEREQMLRIMNRPSRYISREAVGEGAVNLKAVRAYYDRGHFPQRQKESVLNALAQLDRQLFGISKLSPLPAVNYILKVVGYERYLKELAGSGQEKWKEWQEVLEWLKEDASRFRGYKEWKNFQEEYSRTMEEGMLRENGSSVQGGGREGGKRKAVQLLTVHASKGLEFDKVWIPDCNENNFPHGKMPDGKSVEEERRIFYVAMTRAKKSLELLYLTGTKERPRLPSRFLNPLIGGDRSDFMVTGPDAPQ